MKQIFLFFFFLYFSLAIPQSTKAEEQNLIKFAVTDVTGLEELQREFHAFQAILSEKTGLPLKLYPVTSRTAVVEALRSRKLDFALAGPAEYVVIRKRTGAFPVVALARPDYFSAIVVLAGSGINSVSDLKGKKVAFGDVGSTSYHLAPMQILKDLGLNPLQDIQPLHVSKHIGWAALKRGGVDAIGMSHERYVGFRSGEKLLKAGDFRVIARGPDLPNDVIIAGKHVEKEVVEKIRTAFAEFSDEFAKAILTGERNKKYHSVNFLSEVSDRDYDYVRSMYTTAGYPEYSEFIGEES